MKYIDVALIRVIFDEEISGRKDEIVVKDYSLNQNRFNPSKMGRVVIKGFDLEESKTLFRQYLKDRKSLKQDAIDELTEEE